MLIYLGADHRGFSLKESLKDFFKEAGYQFEDLGNTKLDPEDDYPDFASAVAEKVGTDPENNRGILICGSGVGMDVVANKHKGVRSALAFNPQQAAASRRDDHSNVLSLAADFLGEDGAKEIISAWLGAESSDGARYLRRLSKISKIEEGQ